MNRCHAPAMPIRPASTSPASRPARCSKDTRERIRRDSRGRSQLPAARPVDLHGECDRGEQPGGPGDCPGRRPAAGAGGRLVDRTPERDRAGRAPAGSRLAAGHAAGDRRRRGPHRRRSPVLLTATRGFVSAILGSHDTGVLQAVAELAALLHREGVPLHTDAAQVAGKLPVDFRGLGAAAMTVGAHKFRGPLGIGALLLRHDVRVAPLMFGGHQQSGVRPGTESVALAVGMSAALEVWQRERHDYAARLAALRERFEAGCDAPFRASSSTVRPPRACRTTSSVGLPQSRRPGVPGRLEPLGRGLLPSARPVRAARPNCRPRSRR